MTGQHDHCDCSCKSSKVSHMTIYVKLILGHSYQEIKILNFYVLNCNVVNLL